MGFPDSRVGIRDVTTLFRVDYPKPDYNPNCDIIYDLKIDINDIVVVTVDTTVKPIHKS